MNRTLDLRVFRSITGDHATFDACLLKVYEGYTNWNRSTFKQPIPLTVDHFREDLRLRFREFLRGCPGMATQDFSDKRLLLPHLADAYVRTSGQSLHARLDPERETVQEMNVALRSILESRHLNVNPEDHPLHDHYKARPEKFQILKEGETTFAYQKAIGVTEKDLEIARMLLGNSDDDLRDKLLRIHPFLLEADTTHFRTQAQELRRSIEAFVKAKGLLTAEDRRRIVSTIINDWEDNVLPYDLDALEELEREISAERGIEKILDLPPQVMIDHCFTPLLEGEELSDEAKEKLLKRRPIFNHIIMHAGKTLDFELMKNLADTLKTYTRKINITFGDLPHAHLLITAFEMEEKLLLQFLR